MNEQNSQNKKYIVNLGQLCNELDRLTGSSNDYTGYVTGIIPQQTCTRQFGVTNFRMENSLEFPIRDCRLDFSLKIKRIYIRGKGVKRPEQSPYPDFSFGKLSVKATDKLADGSRVYDHLEGTPADGLVYHKEFPPRGLSYLKPEWSTWVVLSRQINPNLLNVTITDADIAKQSSEQAKAVLTKAVTNLEKSNNLGGGKE